MFTIFDKHLYWFCNYIYCNRLRLVKARLASLTRSPQRCLDRADNSSRMQGQCVRFDTTGRTQSRPSSSLRTSSSEVQFRRTGVVPNINPTKSRDQSQHYSQDARQITLNQWTKSDWMTGLSNTIATGSRG